MTIRAIDVITGRETTRNYTVAELAAIAAAEIIANDPPLRSLEPYQFFAALEITGQKASFDSAFVSLLAGLSVNAQIVAKAKVKYTKSFRADNDLVLAVKAEMGLTDAAFKALWRIGEGIV